MSTVDAKHRLLEAVEEALARDGLRGVKVATITKLAGQRNASAVHYHFGSLDGLITAYVDARQASVDEARRRRLRSLGATPSLPELVEAILVPLADLLDEERGRAYLRVLPEIVAVTAWSKAWGGNYSSHGLSTGFEHFTRVRPELPAHLAAERYRAMLLASTTLLGHRAWHDQDVRSGLSVDEFRSNLLAMASAMLDAPIPASQGT